MVDDTINQEQLGKALGGFNSMGDCMDRACDTKACSEDVKGLAPLCTNGDGVCRYGAA